MPFPKTETELVNAGYKFDRVERCKGENCRAEIEFWWTPNGNRMPLDPGTHEPHFATCPDSKRFRRK